MFHVSYTEDECMNRLKKRPIDGIYLLDNIISDKHCDMLREFIDRNAVDDENGVIKNSNVKAYMFSDNSTRGTVYKDIIHSITEQLRNKLAFYYDINFNNYETPILRKIYGNTRIHIDNVLSDMDSHKSNNFRVLSCIMCINDDYEGGELVFPSQNRTIKLKRGQIIVFPPYWTHPHYSEKLKNDTFRYTITTWFCN